MNRKTAAPVILTASLVVLMSGCAGAAAQGGQVGDDLRPAAIAAELGLARGHVVVREGLTPTRVTEESITQAVQQDAARAWSAEARREFHAQQSVQPQSATAWSAEARREFHAQQPAAVTSRTLSPEAIREMKAGAPVEVDDVLSPLGGWTPPSEPPAEPVDDYLSPLGGPR